jgi:hypothetical protein
MLTERDHRRGRAVQMLDSADLATQVAGLELELRFYFDRSLIGQLGHPDRWTEHPSLAEFTRMLDLEHIFANYPAAVAEVRRKWGTHTPGFIASRVVRWEPAKVRRGVGRGGVAGLTR